MRKNQSSLQNLENGRRSWAVIVKFLDFTPFFNDNPLHNAIEQCKLNDRN